MSGAGASLGGNKSSSSGTMSQDVWGPQGDALQNLYSQASSLFNNSGRYSNEIDNIAGNATDNINQNFETATGGFEDMMGGGSVGDTADIRSRLMESIRQTSSSPSNTSSMYQSIVGGPGNTYIDPMVDSMKSGVMDNLNRMQAGNSMDAAVNGQSGSSRQAMADAMLGKEANKDMMLQENSMRMGGYDKDLGMKMDIARLADSNVGASQDKMMSLLGMSDSNTNSAMNYSPNMNSMAMGSMAPTMQAQSSQWAPAQQMGSIIGGPQVLSSGSQSGDSKGASTSANSGSK